MQEKTDLRFKKELLIIKNIKTAVNKNDKF